MVNLNNLFLRIEEKGLNASKVAADVGISTGNISDWKKGRSMPSAVKLDALADYLGCSVDYLLGRTDYIGKEETTIHGDHNVQANKNSGDVTIQQGAPPNRTLCSELEEMLETLPRAVQHRAVADMMELLEEKYLKN